MNSVLADEDRLFVGNAAKQIFSGAERKMTLLIIVLALIAAGVVAAFLHMWRGAKAKKNLADCGWEELKDRVSFLQTCFAILALIIGAGWVVYTWTAQWEEQKKKEQNDEKARIENANETELAGVQVNISAHQEWPPEANKKREFFIAGDILFKNAGTRRTTIRLADGPLFVAKINKAPVLMIPLGAATNPRALPDSEKMEACNSGKVQLGKPQRFWLARPGVDGRPDVEVQDEIRPGEEDQFHFIVRVKNRGTYAVIFSSVDEESKARPLPDDLGPCVAKRQDPMKPRWESSASFVEVK